MTGRTGEQRSHLARPRTAAFPTSAFRAAAEGRPVPGPGAPAGNPSAGGDGGNAERRNGPRRGEAPAHNVGEAAAESEAPLSPDEYDPYAVESCKMLHFPGAAEARGRNVVTILADRAAGGPRHRHPGFHASRIVPVEEDEEEAAGENEGDNDEDDGEGTDGGDMDCSPAGGTPRQSPVSSNEFASPDPPPGRALDLGPLAPRPRRSDDRVKLPGISDRGRNETDEGEGDDGPLPPRPRDVTSELVGHAEYCAATRFRASYLSHLSGGAEQPSMRAGARAPGGPPDRAPGGGDRRNPPGPPAPRLPPRPSGPVPRPSAPRPPNPAVSTISIAVSPDGRTLASTHGDHTVKITCASTGTLIRNLEGHPRTPWTVKYHPANPRIVASGCLGFQVRVWDWDYRTESARREQRERIERRYAGRYDFGGGGACDGDGWDGDGRAKTPSPGPHASPRAVDMDAPPRIPGLNLGGTATPLGAPAAPAADVIPADDDGDDDCPPPHARLRPSGPSDDHGALALASLGIPPGDPAWLSDVVPSSSDHSDGIGVCLSMIRLGHAIISLAFHPGGDVLGVASGNTLHLWDWDGGRSSRSSEGGGGGGSRRTGPPAGAPPAERAVLDRSATGDFPRGRTLDFRHDSPLRCVHFPPGGDSVIVGGVNPSSANDGLGPGPGRGGRGSRGGMSGGGMSFHLRLWDLDVGAVLEPGRGVDPANPGRGGAEQRNLPRARISDDGDITYLAEGETRQLDNPRIIIPRVLLYNDGGFDLSSDGRILTACAEYWLPEGVGSATELLRLADEEERRLRREAEEEEARLRGRATGTPVPFGRGPSLGEGTGTAGAGFGDGPSTPARYASPPRTAASSPPSHRVQASHPSLPFGHDPRTPPPGGGHGTASSRALLEPPSPPGKRNLASRTAGTAHAPHPLSVVAASHPSHRRPGGRYVPHIVAVSLDTSPPADGSGIVPLHPSIVRTEAMRRQPNLGRLLAACPLDGTKASGVTCVKLSPSADYCLLGYGVRESVRGGTGRDDPRHPVAALYGVSGGMRHVCTMTCADDDVNIARFVGESGHGFVYGTKQGRVRVMARRPWNYYHL